MSAVERALRSELERLQVEAEQHRARISESNSRLLALETEIAELQKSLESLHSREDTHDHIIERPLTETNSATTNPFHGLGQPGAVARLLQMEGREMTLSEIMRGLENRGFTIVGRSVDWAVKRAGKLGHIKKIRRGVWVYNQASRSSIEPAEIDHSMRTRAGLMRAKEHGVQLGPPPKITEQHRDLATSMFHDSSDRQSLWRVSANDGAVD
jgi:hypothetical protein